MTIAVRPKNILVVDDDPIVRHALSRIIKVNGFDVVEADDGNSAFEILINRNDIDLVLTDFHMPELDGINLAKLIRGFPGKENLPMGLLTGVSSEDQPAIVNRLFNFTLCKPVDAKTLIGKIQDFLAAEHVQL